MNNHVKHIALIGNAAETLIRFRLDLIRDMVQQGHQVYAFSPSYTDQQYDVVQKAGAVPVAYSKIDRSGLNPLREAGVIFSLKRLFQQHEISLVLSYFVKPSIYGSIAAKLAGVKYSYSMIAGLGYSFTREPGKSIDIKRSALRSLLSVMFRAAFRHNQKVFFQNPDDLDMFVGRNLLTKEKAFRVYGSGVHLDRFEFSNPIAEPVTFITTGRLIKEKGFIEFVEAASLIKKKYSNCRFILLGGTDDNPHSIDHSTVSEWVNEGIIEWPGKVNNVGEWLCNSSVFVLASYYREGTPRSALEAMAIGRPIITTDHPGCRETVVEGENGFLIPVQDSNALATAMERFINDPSLILKYGQKSRQMAEDLYDVRKVNRFMMDEMGLLKVEGCKLLVVPTTRDHAKERGWFRR